MADFPREAEAYWGLVLCKYGIEYVDDPGTGKKIPTCHRSSFDSVMDDSDFEQAMENADVVALRVYREEAKQIEEIRRGILAVSSNEKPYDIFICYKETDENGDRTVDSVLAQDIYDNLTAKGYRVFFSRITLEDKLGQAYEPYIFAALNSAKIMLAVGTRYEYYNAVWVKNEWSRYLKIVAKDKSKYLIPCYKGIDAYDMPKEFAHLQGQDMGKVGAMQDLLRGVEKILPKQQNTTVIQERIVVGGSGNNKIASLLDRGNMALEDGDWSKADSFFEDVLNNDSKNAQAYIGKALAQEKCRTMDAFARKRKEQPVIGKEATLYLPANQAHIQEMKARFQVPGYLAQEEIEALYQFDLHYLSGVAVHQARYEQEKRLWAEHKWLSRAEKFAQGAVAENLTQEKKALLAFFTERVQKAQEREARVKSLTQSNYEFHITQMDRKAEQLHNEALRKRDGDYDQWVMIVKNEPRYEQLRQAETFFSICRGFRDSDALAEHCRKRVADLDAERLAEEARLAAERKAAEEAQAKALAAAKKRKKVMTALVAVLSSVAAVAVAAVILVSNHNRNIRQTYDTGVAALEAEDYTAAVASFSQLAWKADFLLPAGTEDVDAKLDEALTCYVREYADLGLYKYIEEPFRTLPIIHREQNDKIRAIVPSVAAEYAAAGDYNRAINLLWVISEHTDVTATCQEYHYLAAEQYVAENDMAAAAYNYEQAGDYLDAAEKMVEAQYQLGVQRFQEGWFGSAYDILVPLGDYKDCQNMLLYCVAMTQAQENLLDAEDELDQLPDDFMNVAELKALIAKFKKFPTTYQCTQYSGDLYEYGRGVGKQPYQKYFSLALVPKLVQLDEDSPELTPQLWICGKTDRGVDKKTWVIEDMSLFDRTSFSYTLVVKEKDGQKIEWVDFTFRNNMVQMVTHEDSTNTTYEERCNYRFES